jgi:2-polyprenyl-3-methyl-5-hydroxy-6-metoxy-1,4-benzoquinol methylase
MTTSFEALLANIKQEALALDAKQSYRAETTAWIEPALPELSAPERFFTPRRTPRGYLACLDGEEFVRAAYRLVLNREVDPTGLSDYLRQRKAGVPQLLLVSLLMISSEGRQQPNQLPGFFYFRNLALVYRGLSRLGLGWLGIIAARYLTRIYWLRDKSRYQLDQLDSMKDLLIQWRRDFLDSQIANKALRERFIAQVTSEVNQFSVVISETQGRQVDFSQQLDALRARAQYLEEISSQQSADIQASAGRINAITSISGSGASSQSIISPSVASTVEPKLSQALDAYYLAFENSHRGSEDAILGKFKAYEPELIDLQKLSGDFPVLDLGCGRGEWLSYVETMGLPARGIDLNPVMVAAAKGHGLKVEVADLISALKNTANDSCKAITSFHVAEHLPFEVLFQAVGESWRALTKDGLLIMETPNPENILVGSHTFYHDHTHRNPLTPSSMEFLFRFWGFRNVRIKRLSPYPDSARIPGEDLLTERMNGLLCGPQDFAVIGQK